MINRFGFLLVAAGVLSGCGGPPNLTCDEVQPYQQVGEQKRVEVPEDLDSLDPLREMPVPEASPRPSREAGSPCIDLPPGATAMRDAQEEREAEEAEESEEEGDADSSD